MGGSQARRIGKRKQTQSANRAERREAGLVLRAHGMTPEQFRLVRETKRLAGGEKELSEEAIGKMTAEEKAAWAAWQKKHAQGQPTGFTINSIMQKRRPEARP